MRLILVTAEPLLALGVRSLLSATDDLVFSGEATDLRSAVQVVNRETPDVVMIDLALPGASAVPTMREILTQRPGIQVLLITGSGAPPARDILAAVAAGARGVVTRSELADDVCRAVRAVAAGERRLPDGFEAFATRSDESNADVLGILSPRERQIVGLIVDGMSSRDVGRELCISLKTVETHRAHINKKLGCKSPSALIRFAARNGLLGESPSNGAPEQVQAA